jgi:hypothetical protein
LTEQALAGLDEANCDPLPELCFTLPAMAALPCLKARYTA